MSRSKGSLLSGRQEDERVATALIKLNGHLEADSKFPSIITVARKDISSMVGTSTESLNRTLADFKEEGLVEITDRGLRIMNMSRLELVQN